MRLLCGEELLAILAVNALLLHSLESDSHEIARIFFSHLCTLATVFFSTPQTQSYQSLYGDLDWVNDLLKRLDEKNTNDASQFGATILGSLVPNRTKQGLHNVEYNDSQNCSPAIPQHEGATEQFYNWYALCSKLGRIVKTINLQPTYHTIALWAQQNKATSSEIIQASLAINFLSIPSTSIPYKENKSEIIYSCISAFIWQLLPYLDNKTVLYELASCFFEPDPSEATLLVYAISPRPRLLSWLNKLDDRATPLILKLISTQTTDTNEIESFFPECLTNEKMTIASRLVIFERILIYYQSKYEFGLDRIIEFFTYLDRLVDRNTLHQDKTKRVVDAILQLSIICPCTESLYSTAQPNKHYSFSELPLLEPCLEFIQTIVQKAGSFGAEESLTRSIVCKQLINSLIYRVAEITKEHMQDSEDTNRNESRAVSFSIQQPRRIAVKNVLLCAICKLYCQISDDEMKAQAFRNIKKLENGHSIKIIGEVNKDTYTREIYKAPHNLVLFRFALALFMDERQVRSYSTTVPKTEEIASAAETNQNTSSSTSAQSMPHNDEILYVGDERDIIIAATNDKAQKNSEIV